MDDLILTNTLHCLKLLTLFVRDKQTKMYFLSAKQHKIELVQGCTLMSNPGVTAIPSQ